MQTQVLKLVFSYISTVPLVLLLCTVFIIDNSITQEIVMGQTFWFYKILPFLSFATFISYLINQKPVYFSVIDGLFSLFIISGAIVTTVATREVNAEIGFLYSILLFYFLIKIQLSQVQNSSLILIICFLATGLIEAIWGVRQLYGFTHSQHSLFKTTGSFFNPGPYAGYLAMVAPMALHFFIKDSKGSIGKISDKMILAIAAISLISIIIVLPPTGSRASWLSTIVGCIAVVVLHNRRLVKSFAVFHFKKIILIAIIGFMAIGTALYGLYIFKKDSADGRLLIWKNTIEQIKDNPMGTGIGLYAGSYGKYQAEYFKNGNGTEQEKMVAGVPKYAFNEYLQICAEWGIIPFVLFLAVLGYTISSAIKNKKTAPLGALVSLLVFASMSYPFSLMPFIISFVMLIALCNSTQYEKSIKKVDIKVILFCISAICLTVYAATKQKRIYESYQEWTRFHYLYRTKSYETAEKSYSEEYHMLKNNVEYLFEYGHILSNTGDYRKSNLILERAISRSCDPMIYNIIGKNYQAMGEYDQAIKNYLFATDLVPNRLYPHYLLTELYVELNDLQKAKETAQNLLDMSVKVTSPASKQMREEMKTFLNSLEKRIE